MIPVVAVAIASAIVSLIRYFSARNPAAQIYLAAIAVSFWYGQEGPGVLAFSMSTVCLLAYFRVLAHSWLQVERYDLPTICLYVIFV